MNINFPDIFLRPSDHLPALFELRQIGQKIEYFILLLFKNYFLTITFCQQSSGAYVLLLLPIMMATALRVLIP